MRTFFALALLLASPAAAAPWALSDCRFFAMKLDVFNEQNVPMAEGKARQKGTSVAEEKAELKKTFLSDLEYWKEGCVRPHTCPAAAKALNDGTAPVNEDSRFLALWEFIANTCGR